MNNRVGRIFLSSIASSAIAISAFAQSVLADPRDFMLNNHSSAIIESVYVSPANSNLWGVDVLGNGLLFAGYEVPIRFNSNANTCYYDIDIQATDRQPTYLWGVDLCSTYVVNYW